MNNQNVSKAAKAFCKTVCEEKGLDPDCPGGGDFLISVLLLSQGVDGIVEFNKNTNASNVIQKLKRERNNNANANTRE